MSEGAREREGESDTKWSIFVRITLNVHTRVQECVCICCLL
jgi:hypothetical protein